MCEKGFDSTGESKEQSPAVISFRFPRTVRLLNNQDYQRVFNKAHCKSSDQYLTILAVRNELGIPRLGLALTKKKLKKAVSRHRLKRLVRESFRQHKDLLIGLDIVVMGQKVCEETSNQVLFNKLDAHWLRLTQRCSEVQHKKVQQRKPSEKSNQARNANAARKSKAG